MMQEKDLWHESPSSEILLGPDGILAMNQSARDLLGLVEKDIGSTQWLSRVFDQRALKKFETFLAGPAQVSAGLEVRAGSGDLRYVRFLKRPVAHGSTIISVQDITETREDAQAFQAGYDEFIRVTMDLEEALSTIEKQNKLVERQKQVLESELQVAHLVQNQILAQDFSRHTLMKVHGAYQAMSDLGGDMWEFYESREGLWTAIGDVMGHGVASSLISIAAKSIFRKCFEDAVRAKHNLARLMQELNSGLLDITNSNYFLTTAVLHITPDYRLEYLTAGHPPILHIPANPSEPVKLLFTEQPMLGIFRTISYRSEETRLSPKDRILLYTDCLIESPNAAGDVIQLEQYGEQLRYKPDESPEQVVNRVLDYRREFSGSDSLPDDLTMICLQVPEKLA
jgi:serine phosphatase RsbU (regulator of sigma subunit)